MVIPDLQIPFEAKNALSFATQVKKHYGIKDENCLCVGDELDSFYGSAGIAYIRTKTQNLWGFNVGSLIDPDAYAFHYSKYSRFKANLGIGVIAGGGTTPIWIPYE